ncbi:MAG: HAD family hydrolase [Mucilaginibacter sp.]
MKKALIFDLDNTIYPVSSIADNLFVKLFKVLDDNEVIINNGDADTVSKIKEEMTRRPFQAIADKYGLNDHVRQQMIQALSTLSYNLPMEPFEDYKHLRDIPLDKFLVTSGFAKLQYSKIKQLDIERDFKEIFVVDLETSNQTKKETFEQIMKKYSYEPQELLIIGDDPESEIKAALELGIDTFLFDPNNLHRQANTTYRSESLKQVLQLL